MLVRKRLGFRGIMNLSGHHFIWLIGWSALVTVVFENTHWRWMVIPWLPLSVIGTAVAFYIGFKNNQAYDRLWEARKIWCYIESSSKIWGTNLKAYISNQFTKTDVPDEVINQHVKKMVYSHIAWLYSLRYSLLKPTQWEHINQGILISRATEHRIKYKGSGLVEDEMSFDFVRKVFTKEERDNILSKKNRSITLINNSSQILKDLRKDDLIDDFRHMELQKILNEFIAHQEKCERIKKFPLPRQYGSMSNVFVGIFIFLLPFGMVSEFAQLGAWGTWLSIPFSVLVNWLFLTMELVGDYSENPFEGLSNDIPMMSICRNIEIDLLEMIGESDIPKPIEAKGGVLM